MFILNSRYFEVQTEGPSDFFFDRVEGGDGGDGGTEEEDVFADLLAQVADDEAILEEFLAVDDDNAPLPDNILAPNEYIDYIFEDWKVPGLLSTGTICYKHPSIAFIFKRWH